jgi:putative ABC transport system permease protein
MSLTNGDDPDRPNVKLLIIDESYPKFYGIKLLAGRYLIPSDTSLNSELIKEDDRIKRVVINEKAVQALHFGTNGNAIGKRFWFGFGGGKGEIVGVVANFNTGSLHEAMAPALMIQAPFVSETAMKIAANTPTPQVISAVEAAWKRTYPDGIFEYRFLDEQIDSFYKAETKLFALFKVFSVMAMVICCLGLWGLASFAAEQRVKEIGIRKVLGASVSGLVALLSQDFLKMVGLAIIIAAPLAWYFMHQWLEGFAYRTNISYWVFVITAVIAIVITILTVGFRAIRAAAANPVDSLRNE